MKPGASEARRSRVKPAAEAITRSVELQSDTELSHAEPEVRIHLPPAVSPVRTTGSGATFAMGRVARREMILRSKRYPRVDRVVCSMALDTD